MQQTIVNALKPYLADVQLAVLMEQTAGSEGAFFRDRLQSLVGEVESAPRTYQQRAKGNSALAHFHYFLGGSEWFITELDMEGGVDQAFGLAVLNGDWEMAEQGYISITEIVGVGAELDLHWKPQTLAEILAAKQQD